MALKHNRQGAEPAAWRRVAATLLVLALLSVLAATIAPLLHAIWPLLSLLQHFAVQLGSVSVLLLIAALLLRLWRPASLAFALTVWHGMVLYPFLLPSEARAVEAGPPLKVLSLNLWYENEDHARTVDMLLRSGADVI